MLFCKSHFMSKCLFKKKLLKPRIFSSKREINCAKRTGTWTLRGSNWVQSCCFPRDPNQLEVRPLPPCPPHLSGRQRTWKQPNQSRRSQEREAALGYCQGHTVPFTARPRSTEPTEACRPAGGRESRPGALFWFIRSSIFTQNRIPARRFPWKWPGAPGAELSRGLWQGLWNGSELGRSKLDGCKDDTLLWLPLPPLCALSHLVEFFLRFHIHKDVSLSLAQWSQRLSRRWKMSGLISLNLRSL